MLIAASLWPSSHTLHLAAQLLDGLGGGLVVVRELLPGGDRVGTGAVRQAALRGALVGRPLLLPVQMVFHHELQLWKSGEEKKKKNRGDEKPVIKAEGWGGLGGAGSAGRTRQESGARRRQPMGEQRVSKVRQSSTYIK